MRTTRTPRSGIGLTLCTLLALGHAGCQPATSPADQPARMEAEATASVSPPTALAAPAPRELPPVDTIKQVANQAENAFDSGVRQTVREVEQGVGQPLSSQPPPLTAPAPDATATVTAEAKAVVAGEVEQVTDVVRQKGDELKQDVRKTAEQLEQKAHTDTRRFTEHLINKVEKDAKDQLQQGYNRAGKKIRRELAPKNP